MRPGLGVCSVERFGEGFIEDVIDEGTFSASAYAGNDGKGSERKRNINVFEVIVPCPANHEPMQGLLGGVRFGRASRAVGNTHDVGENTSIKRVPHCTAIGGESQAR